jgi:hypothetical protein
MTNYMHSILEDHNTSKSFCEDDFLAVVGHLTESSKHVHMVSSQQEKTTRWFNSFHQTSGLIRQWHTLSDAFGDVSSVYVCVSLEGLISTCCYGALLRKTSERHTSEPVIICLRLWHLHENAYLHS